MRAGALVSAAAAVRGASITKTGSDPALGSQLQVDNVGSGDFDPAKLKTWHRDMRYPLLPPNPGGSCPGNIYNANAVNNGRTAWNVYFGGWDGVSSCHDSVSVSVTLDTFATMNPHAPQIATGSDIHVNNPSAIKVNSTFWAIVYTQLAEARRVRFADTRPGQRLVLTPEGCAAGERYSAMVLRKGRGEVVLRWDAAARGGPPARLGIPAERAERAAWLDAGAEAAPLNKPGVSTGPDGVRWSPSAGGADFITMDGYPYDWAAADVNGGNVLLHDPAAGEYHLYFVDFKQLSQRSVFRATSADLSTFRFQNVALPEPGRVVNDVELVNGYYLMGMHANSQRTWFSASADPTSFPPSEVLFEHFDDADKYIVSTGFVIDSTARRVLGVLYGAGAESTLDHNSVFAVWLQRKVLFIGGGEVWGAGDASRSVGPDTARLLTTKSSLEGKFYVYDSDYVDISNRGTLLYTSPMVNASVGDIWQYSP